MTDAKIQEEVLKHTKIKPKAGETAEALTWRVADKVNKMADSDPKSWDNLTEATQKWVNDNVELQAIGAELNLLVLETEADAETDEDPPAEEAAADEPKERPVSKTKAKAAAKKVVKAKPAPAKKVAAAKPVKAAPKKAAPAKAKAANGAGRGRTPLHPDTGVIKVLAKENPHREGTIRDKAFKKVKTGMTVAEAVKAGCPAQQVWSMAHRGLISVTAR